MKAILSLLLLVVGFTTLRAQDRIENKLLPQDSLELAHKWNQLRPFLLGDNREVPPFINDSIYCELCIGEEQSIKRAYMSKARFVKKGLSTFTTHSKIMQAIRTEKPNYSVSPLYNVPDHWVWTIYFVYWKPHEIAVGHEGATVLFEFERKDKEMKLVHVSSVP